MLLLVRFKTAPLPNNYDYYGWQLKTTAKSTKSSTTTSISRFCAPSGQNALKPYGTSKNRQLVVENQKHVYLDC
jgi:hypothetical protein